MNSILKINNLFENICNAINVKYIILFSASLNNVLAFD
ncbi:hypothetical protein SAMN05421827_12040 [Pedobacter terrae]|uniref:Uncharacterized protein n=1 Tax=Pedobacter terrae TaxID=405671 RepID=A0A1G8AX88_9SPHI|nr:hypothetical protein SAMN05421827_12040 [Pedobacter terrae]